MSVALYLCKSNNVGNFRRMVVLCKLSYFYYIHVYDLWVALFINTLRLNKFSDVCYIYVYLNINFLLFLAFSRLFKSKSHNISLSLFLKLFFHWRQIYDLNFFKTFLASLRKVLFFQKNINEFKEEFNKTNMVNHPSRTTSWKEFKANGWKTAGRRNDTNEHITTIIHDFSSLIFFKNSCSDFLLDDVLSSLLL